MKRRTLFFLSAYNFHARVWRSGTVSEEYTFADDFEGHEQFAAFLQKHRDPALILTDLIEEDFRSETVPHLIGRQRRDQQRRKFEQFYRNTPFRQAKLLRRLEEGRRDDEVLFSALTNPHLIMPWLDIIHAQQIPLIGIYSVPTISAPLLSDIPSDHILLLSWEKDAGLRQSYFNNKRLFLSRLSPVGAADSYGNIVAAETARTLQYLKNLSMLPHGEILHVGIICHASDKTALEQSQYVRNDITYHYLDIQNLARHFKLDFSFQDSDATALLLGLVAVKSPTAQYAPSQYTHIYQLHQFQRYLYLASLAVFSACLLWSAVNIWQGGSMNSASSNLEQQAIQLEQRTREIISQFPNQLARPEDMKSAVTVMRTLNGYALTPQAVWDKLSAVLDKFPRIRLDSLAWQTEAGSADNKGASGLQGQGLLINGELTDWNGDYRSALSYVDAFQQALKQQGYDVSVLSLPLDVSSKGSITETTPGSDQPRQALFSLKLTWTQTP